MVRVVYCDQRINLNFYNRNYFHSYFPRLKGISELRNYIDCLQNIRKTNE